MYFEEQESLTADEIEQLVNPFAKKEEVIRVDSIESNDSVEERISNLEEIIFSLLDQLRDKNIITSKSKVYKGMPIGTKLFSYPGKDRKNKKVLLVSDGKFVLNTGVETNSLFDAMKIVAPQETNPLNFWRLGGHLGPSVGSVFNPPT